ncbi:hypothetical protein JW711_06160 [Candidatus Woesearchaeota archaeon]|nr:hypothetical protein [Candidatus Woesearchaeota archaeon]
MSKRRRFVSGIILAGITLLASTFSSRFISSDIPTKEEVRKVSITLNKGVHEYLRHGIEDRISAQNNQLSSLGIRHPYTSVKAKVLDRDGFFRLCTDCPFYTSAMVDSHDESIVFLMNAVFNPKDEELYKKIEYSIYTTSRENMQHVTDHELGHMYLHPLMRTLNVPSFGEVMENREEYWSRRFLEEGIAEYFGRRMNGLPDDFNGKYWPSNASSWQAMSLGCPEQLYYNGAFHGVKPLIDEWGVAAIAEMLKSPPIMEELYALESGAYTKRIRSRMVGSGPNQNRPGTPSSAPRNYLQTIFLSPTKPL